MKLPSTRKDAIRLGANYYFTGKRCKHDHLAKRHVNRGACVECVNIKKRDTYADDPAERAKQRANQRKWRQTQDGKTSERNRELRKRYGIDEADYQRLLSDQGGKCAVCRIDQCKTGKRFAVDHCHETGKIRGLLCANCNTALGKLNDDPALVRAALEYLS